MVSGVYGVHGLGVPEIVDWDLKLGKENVITLPHLMVEVIVIPSGMEIQRG